MAQRRRFSGREHTDLFLAADGRCEECGVKLEAGWHADHEEPWSRGGITDVINGRALCPPCNRKKGSSVSGLREWQQRAKDAFLAADKQNFLVSATPGAGKTRFALDLARDLIDAGRVQRVVVVVPSDTLRTQWADEGDAYGLPLIPVSEPTDYEKSGYRGCVVSYQQLRYGANLLRRATRVPTLAIIDEIHHAGEGEKYSWGKDLNEALEYARYRLALTGTPWRRDKYSPIPFIEYGEDGRVKVDVAYEYGEAVADGVCRPIEFHAYDGEANWRDPNLPTPLVSVSLTDVGKPDVGIALSTVFDPGSPWIKTLLTKGAQALDVLREEVPDAAGLVVADDQYHAAKYAKALEAITGEKPALATSDIPEAKDIIRDFKKSSQRWLVAVRMVSEGVDIRRLAVGVYATRDRTPLLFRQIVGRFVRTRTDTDPNALLFIPAIEEFVSLAREIEEELRHQLEREAERTTGEADDQEDTLFRREPLSASEAALWRAVYKGDEIKPTELESAKQACRQFGIPVWSAAGVAKMLRVHEHPASSEAGSVTVIAPEATPRHRQERLLRSQVERLVRRVAYRREVKPQQVAIDLLQAGFPQRNQATVEQLRQMEDVLGRWLTER
jgi:superfamily II DNA or RNA helicase